ncbi:hypothetical protein BDF20DRAFT_838414 [Mycotypha africana]|uniref:uncharacterized protein n=1 Tax=Mycotypha africana TaxID=64632 RepID=UPI00230147D5|nr:uncharacterized protein BDF20DRAFT_838414 [Mycotypha africana]KAI8970006.1 hypothetical protein BDF20DRAFT_838414 [Mycotypha africana]
MMGVRLLSVFFVGLKSGKLIVQFEGLFRMSQQMDSTQLSDIAPVLTVFCFHFYPVPSVRLASGIEMQQRWPSTLANNQQQQQAQKEGQAPRLIELTPTKGSQGIVVTVVVQSLPHPMVPVKLAFNSLVVDTKQMQAQGITSLAATVPPFQHTHSTSVNVPISICMLDGDTVTETWPVAQFIYEFEPKESTVSTATTPLLTSAPTTASTLTANTDQSAFPLTKLEHPPTPYQPTPSKEENFLGGTTSTATSCYNNFYEQPVNDFNTVQNQSYNYSYQNRDIFNSNKFNSYNPNNDTSRSNNQQQQQQQQQPPPSSLNFDNGTTPFSLFQSGHAGFTNVLTGYDQPDATQILPAPTAHYSSMVQHESTQQQQRSSAPVTPSIYSYNKSYSLPSTSVANYQPYPGLISRANLKIMGDLDSMAKSWSNEEWEHRRRLVQFWREQNGNEIRCTFEPVAQGDRISTSNGNIIVSCIYWAERNDCFITSVDCIHLLESLMDIRFSVEEKNRVRRNLEGFRPLTVSKCKPDSAEFFKLIMSFPNPKPRNIEKDVKVFPWKTLPYALKKIVTKYTASSYNAIGSHTQQQQQQQQRRTQLKNALITPTPAPTPTPPVTTTTTTTTHTNPAFTATSCLGQPTPSQDNTPSYNFYPQQTYPSTTEAYHSSPPYNPYANSTPSGQPQQNSYEPTTTTTTTTTAATTTTTMSAPTTMSSLYQSTSIPAFSSAAYNTTTDAYSLQPLPSLQPQQQQQDPYTLSPSASYAPTTTTTTTTTPSPGNI